MTPNNPARPGPTACSSSSVMQLHGFKPYPYAWWHFTFAVEPYPETYFNFPVK